MELLKPLRWIVLATLITGGSGASAAIDLYTATAPVAEEGADARSQAIGDAMLAVLRKLSGRRDIAGRTGLEQVLDAAPGYVQQFRYVSRPGAAAEGARDIWVRFDPGAVDRALRDLGLPVWNTPRPRTLVWIAVERRGRRELFNPASLPGLLPALRQQAGERGLPLQLPLMDLEDQTRLNVGDLWNSFEEPVRAASERYNHDAILIGRIRALGKSNWQGSWTLMLPGSEPVRFESGTTGLGRVARNGVDLAVDRMAARFAPVDAGDGPSRLALRVFGVDGVNAYAAILAAVQRQQAVTRLSVRYVAQDQLQLDVWVTGGMENLKRGLTLDSRFQPEMVPLPSTTPPLEPTLPETAEEPAGTGAADASGAVVVVEQPVAAPAPDYDIAYRWAG